jgi:hypothetical protein
MNDNLERVREEVVVAKRRYYPGICLKGLKKPQNTSVRIAAVATSGNNFIDHSF